MKSSNYDASLRPWIRMTIKRARSNGLFLHSLLISWFVVRGSLLIYGGIPSWFLYMSLKLGNPFPCKVLSLPFGQDRRGILPLGGIGFIVSWILKPHFILNFVPHIPSHPRCGGPVLTPISRRIRSVADHPNKQRVQNHGGDQSKFVSGPISKRLIIWIRMDKSVSANCICNTPIIDVRLD